MPASIVIRITGNPAASGNIANYCGSATNDSPGVFPRGETVVPWTATDAAGNAGTATQIVTAKKAGGGGFGFGEFFLLFLFVAIRRKTGHL